MPWDCSSRTSCAGVGARQLAVRGSVSLEAHPHPRDPEGDQVLHRVEPEGVGGAEDHEGPGLAVLLHQLQQPHGPLAVQQEVLVHDEERRDAHLLLEPGHELVQLVARGVEIERLPLAPEHGRRGAEVAAQGAADRRDDGGRGVRRRRPSRGPPGCGCRSRTGSAGGGSAASGPHPGSAGTTARPRPRTTWSASVSSWIRSMVGHVPADDDRRLRLDLADELAHLRHLADVRDDGADADHVVLVLPQLGLEALEVRESRAACTGASMLAWMSISPQERWNMRSEKGPCTRVTWFW